MEVFVLTMVCDMDEFDYAPHVEVYRTRDEAWNSLVDWIADRASINCETLDIPEGTPITFEMIEQDIDANWQGVLDLEVWRAGDEIMLGDHDNGERYHWTIHRFDI